MATIRSLLSEHVTLQVRSVDRIFLAGYVPRLQCDGQLVRFLNDRAGGTIPSPAMLGKIGRGYAEEINRFANANEISVVRFTKDMVKEDVARPHMQQAERDGRTGVVMLGVAQEKAWAWRGWRDGGHDAHPHFEFAAKPCSSTTTTSTSSIPTGARRSSRPTRTRRTRCGSTSTATNGRNAKPPKKGIDFEPLDNGFRACDQAERLTGICDSLSERDIFRFCDRWMHQLPSPFTTAQRGWSSPAFVDTVSTEPGDVQSA